MTREVIRGYRVDPARVYVAGLSAGGAMAAVLGTAYPDLYAAVCVHSGLASGSAHDLSSAIAAMYGMPSSKSAEVRGSSLKTPPTPTIVFHGDKDKTVHPRNGEQLVSRSLEQSGASHADPDIENGQVPGGHAYTRAVHRDSTGRVVLEYWRVHGGGHAWFGGSPLGSYTDPHGPDASREMMRFFLQNGLKRAAFERMMAGSLA
jgi:poly(3-hydroxybutyrate) depolymerase